METPIWRTPKFWRELAKEWRGPETFATCEGICWQLDGKFPNSRIPSELACFLWQFSPSPNKVYFFPVGDDFRHLRAELCDRIATHLEHEANQAQTSPAQGPTANQLLL